MDNEDPKFVAEVESLMDKFEQEMIGLSKWGRKDVPPYLDMPIEQLRKKTSDELGEAVYLLNQYSLNIQRLINRNKAWERCLNSQLNELEARYLSDVPQGYGFNERPKIARYNPEICQRLNKFLRKVQVQADMLYDIPRQVKAVADSIRDMRFIALNRERNHE
jgi:hypothetical protein